MGAPGRDNAAAEPVIDHAGTDAELVCGLLDAQLVFSFQLRCRDAVFIAQPLDHRKGEALALGTKQPLLVQPLNDVCIDQRFGQFANLIDDRSRISRSVPSPWATQVASTSFFWRYRPLKLLRRYLELFPGIRLEDSMF